MDRKHKIIFFSLSQGNMDTLKRQSRVLHEINMTNEKERANWLILRACGI